MLKKFICFVICLSVMLLCLPVFSFASEDIYYASIPRPISSDHVKYVVAHLKSQSEPILYLISVPDLISSDYFWFQFGVGASGDLRLYIGSTYPVTFTVFVNYFDLNGNYIDSFSHQVPVSDTVSVVDILWLGIDELYSLDPYDIPVSDNVMLYNIGLPSISWSDNTDPVVYTSWLQRINSMLNEIDYNTDYVEAHLSDISSQLTLFYSVFNSYQSQMVGNISTIISALNTLNSRLNSFSQQNHYDLQQIYSMLSQIYSLLSEDQTTRAPAIEDQSEVNNILQNEASLNKDFSGDLNQQFDVAGNIFESNSSFSFISNLFQELILDVPALNSLVIFALAIGLCVLILGRRLNA